jgi:hypothetical protein
MIQDKIFFDEKDPTGVSYNTPFTVYGSYEGRLWSKTPSGEIKYYTQNSDLSVYATTGSNQFSGSQTVTGSLTVTGQVVAQTLNVQQVTSSIVFSSGSNVFGNSQSNTQQFTGSVSVTGSLAVAGTGTFSSNGLFGGSSAISGLAGGISVNGSTNSGINFRIADTLRGYVYVAGNGSMNLESTSGSVVLAPNGSPALTISSTGAATFTGKTSIFKNHDDYALAIVNTDTNGYGIYLQAGSTNNAIDVFNAAGTSQIFTVKGNGTVGIGTATLANEKLTVVQTTGNASALYVRTSGVTTGQSYGLTIEAGTNSSDASFRVFNQAGTTQYFGVRGDGNVGIGTASPSVKLQVNSGGTGSNSFSAFFTDNTANQNGLAISHSDNNSRIYATFNTGAGSDQDLSFWTTLANGTQFERMRITAGGNVFINNSSGVTLNDLTNRLSVSSTTYNLFDISRFSDNTFGPNFYLVKSRNGSIGGNTIVANGDNLGNINWVGANGTGFTDAASIKAEVDGTPGASDMPGRLVFSTTADGTTNNTERMRITSDGLVGIGTIDPLATLATMGGAVQIMGDYPNHQTIIKSAGTSGTFSGQLTITIPQMSNASTDGFGGYSCEVYVAGFEGWYCHAWFSGYINGGITSSEATILRSNGGWSISQAAFGANNQGFQFVVNYPAPYIVHPTARIIFNKGGSINATAYPANNITAVFS